MKLVACALSVALLAGQAGADPTFATPPLDEPRDTSSSLSYLVDGGALPFFWGALAGRLALDRWAKPRESPLFFSSSEGGAERSSWEIPGYAITSVGVAFGGAMVLSGDASRMYHVKGLAESLMTGSLVTGLIKTTVGRHRPDWAADGSGGNNRSFPSGHSTQAFAIATYAALYLRHHVFDSRRGDARLPWWEAATYGGLFLGASAFAAERVLHNRHHLSDVMIGGALGTATSTLFYLYQDGRFSDAKAREGLASLQVQPQVSSKSAGLSMSFLW